MTEQDWAALGKKLLKEHHRKKFTWIYPLNTFKEVFLSPSFPNSATTEDGETINIDLKGVFDSPQEVILDQVKKSNKHVAYLLSLLPERNQGDTQ